MKSVHLPDDVYRRAVELAEVDHVSVDKLVAAIVNERASRRPVTLLPMPWTGYRGFPHWSPFSRECAES
jgi:hypothetical protein